MTPTWGVPRHYYILTSKGKKKILYREVFNKKYRTGETKTYQLMNEITNNQIPNCSNTDLIDFARLVEEDPYILELFNYYEFEIKKHKNRPSRVEIETAIETLFWADRQIYYDPTKNWDEAITSACFKYENIRTVEAIDSAYSQYLMYRELGIQQPLEGYHLNDKYIFDHKRWGERRELKKGRKLSEEENI